MTGNTGSANCSIQAANVWGRHPHLEAVPDGQIELRRTVHADRDVGVALRQIHGGSARSQLDGDAGVLTIAGIRRNLIIPNMMR